MQTKQNHPPPQGTQQLQQQLQMEELERLNAKQQERTQLLLQDDEQRAQQLRQDQEQILQKQGALLPLDPEAIARSSSQAMGKAMGGIHQPQPDVPREQWGDIPVGKGEDEDLGRLWEETQEELPRQTYVPPETQAEQQRLWQQAQQQQQQQQQQQSDERMAAALEEKPEGSTAAGNEESPDRAAGSQSMVQMLAELETWPKRYTC